jgi:hypothetical protein
MKRIALLLCLIPQLALAQTPPPPPSADGLSAQNDPAAARYHAAFQALASGNRAAAIASLEKLNAQYPDHPLAERARLLIGIMAPGINGPQDQLVRGEKPTGLARGELVAAQTLHGIAIGGEICLILECNDGRAVVGLLLVGGGLGLTASLLYDSDKGMTPGHAAALNSGTVWGAWQGGALIGIMEPDSTPTVGATLLLSQLGGLGLGEVLHQTLEPTAGDVSMATSAGFWTGVLAFFGHAANKFDGDSRTTFATILIASDLGLLAGAVASKYYPMTRSRTLVVDAGGILGALVGMGVPFLIQNEDSSPGLIFGGAIVGTLAGLGSSYYLTRNWDAPEDLSLQLNVTPVEGGATVGVGGLW